MPQATSDVTIISFDVITRKHPTANEDEPEAFDVLVKYGDAYYFVAKSDELEHVGAMAAVTKGDIRRVIDETVKSYFNDHAFERINIDAET